MSSISPFVEKTQIEIRVHKIERPRDRVIPDRSTLSRPSTRWQVSRKDPMVNSSHPDGFPSPMKFRSSVWYHPDANFVSFLIIPYNHEGFSVLELGTVLDDTWQLIRVSGPNSQAFLMPATASTVKIIPHPPAPRTTID